MQVTDVRVRKVTSQNRMKAIASITIDDVFVIHDIKVIESDKGLFIAMLILSILKLEKCYKIWLLKNIMRLSNLF